MVTHRHRLPLLLLPALALAGCGDEPVPTGPADPLVASTHEAGHCVVTSAGDAGPGTLRDAIDDPACTTITFDLAGPIELTGLPLMILRNMTIDGPGADRLTVRRSEGAGGILVVEIGVTAGISGLTISGGREFMGGGIANGGTLTVARSTISGNSADNLGGGIVNFGTLIVIHSTISGNSAPEGGGIQSVSGTLTVAHSTISGNTATLHSGAGISSWGPATLLHSTVVENSFASTALGGIASISSLTLRNTIVAGNGRANCHDHGGLGTITDAGYNLEDGTNCGFSANTSHSSTAPLLGPLADNGGPTRTHALLAGSPAIDAGTCTDYVGSPVSDDQRGVARPQGPACDIGAFELEVAVEDLLASLIALSVETPGVSAGTSNKLRDALKHAVSGRTGPACNALAGYIDDLESQAGKPGKVSAADAAALIEAAERIRTSLGC